MLRLQEKNMSSKKTKSVGVFSCDLGQKIIEYYIQIHNLDIATTLSCLPLYVHKLNHSTRFNNFYNTNIILINILKKYLHTLSHFTHNVEKSNPLSCNSIVAIL